MSKERAKKVIKKMVEITKKKDRKMTKGKILKDAGYSDNYSKQPSKFFKTKTVQELRAKYLPMDLIYKVHNELLAAAEISHYIFPVIKGKKELTDQEIKDIIESTPGCELIYIKRGDNYMGTVAFFRAPDNNSRDKALDKAYKIYGNYAPEKVEVIDKNRINDKDLEDGIEKAQEELNLSAKSKIK